MQFIKLLQLPADFVLGIEGRHMYCTCDDDVSEIGSSNEIDVPWARLVPSPPVRGQGSYEGPMVHVLNKIDEQHRDQWTDTNGANNSKQI